MTTQLDPFGEAVPFVGLVDAGGNVRVHPQFLRYWQQLFARVGGEDALSNTELGNGQDDLTAELDALSLEVAEFEMKIELSDYQETITPLVMDGVTGNHAALESYLGPSGSLFTAGRVKSIVPTGGTMLVDGLLDWHPSISGNWLARGGILFVPGDNLPGMTANIAGATYGAGAEAAAIRMVRDSPVSDLAIAWSPDIGGFNIDFRTSTQFKAVFTIDTVGNTLVFATPHPFVNGWTVYPSAKPLANISSSIKAGNQYIVGNATSLTLQLLDQNTLLPITLSAAGAAVQTLYCQIDGVRLPNPQGSNPFDPDPNFDTKKDYVGGYWHDMDIIGAPGYGWRGEPGNGRANFFNVRLLNCDLDGANFGDNDKVMGGHSAAGGNGQSGKGYGYHVGQASGFFAVTQNVWGCDDYTIRNVANAAGIAHVATAYFACTTNNFNEACRFSGGPNYNNAGVYAANQYHPHANLFGSDGVAGDAYATGDPSLQSHNAVVEYQGLTLAFNSYVRTDSNKKAFKTLSNFGGTTDGTTGTAFQTVLDLSQSGSTVTMVNSIDSFCSAPDVKPWTSLPQAITSATSVGGVLTLTCTAHGLQPNDNVGFYVTGGTAPSGITTNTVVYWVGTPDNNTLTLYTAPVADFTATPLPFVNAGTGTLTMYNLSTSPYAQDHGNLLNYGYWDCYRALYRVGAMTPKSNNLPANGPLAGYHHHFAFGIAETDNANAAYAGEAGDRTTDPISGALWRYALYGSWETDHALAMTYKAWRRISTSNAGSTTVKAYEPLVFFQTASAGIASYAITLPTGMLASYRMTLLFKGGQITTNTWTATLNAGSPGLPLTIGGWCVIELEWLADNQEWNVLSVYPSTGWTTSATLTGAVASDLSQSDSFFVGPITGNVTISNPTNPIDQKTYTWYVTQDGTGGHSISLGGKFVRSALTTTVDTTLSTSTLIQAKYNLKTDKYYISGFQTKMS